MVASGIAPPEPNLANRSLDGFGAGRQQTGTGQRVSHVPVELGRITMSELTKFMQSKAEILLGIRNNLLQVLPQAGTLDITGQISFHRFYQGNGCSGSCLYRPMLSFMIQGDKEAEIGDMVIPYSAGDVFITGLELPAKYRVLNQSDDEPGLSVSLRLEPTLIQEVVQQLQPLEQQQLIDCDMCALSSQANFDELMTVYRLTDMYVRGIHGDYPYSLLLKELYYYVLTAQHGLSLRKLFTSGAHDFKIAKAINFLKDNYRDEIAIESLADMVYMAVPTFYKHFKEATSLSPLQYVKRLRLHEAKRLMLDENFSAAAAGYEVGYVSEQHFSRDYKKLFGRPPLQDIKDSSLFPRMMQEELCGSSLHA